MGTTKQQKNLEYTENTAKLYNANAEQTVNLSIVQGPTTFSVSHVLSALSDKRFLVFDKEAEKLSRKMLALDKLGISRETFLADQKENLWDELALARIGYAEKADWKEKTHSYQKVSAINALLFAQPFIKAKENQEENQELENQAKEEIQLFDEDAVIEISLRTIFNGNEIITTHCFRTETKAEDDEYLAILSNQPQKNALASAVKSKSERYADLYDALCQVNIGYVDEIVPIWHKIEVVIYFFEMQLRQLGKS